MSQQRTNQPSLWDQPPPHTGEGDESDVNTDETYLNISPHVYVVGAVTVSLFSFVLFRRYGAIESWFFVPIFALAGLWGAVNTYRQSIGRSLFQVDKTATVRRLFGRALARYTVWLAIIYLGLQFYQWHPFYQSHDKAIAFVGKLFDLYLVLGLPYFIITLRYKASRREDFYDPAVRLWLLAKKTLVALLRWRGSPAVRAWRNKYNRKVVLNLIMRSYFLPVMVMQVVYNLEAAIKFSANDFNQYDGLTVLFFLSSMLWFTDAVAASTAYGIESRWTENRSRSIDMTVGGWLICLCCYAPLNQITGAVFPFGPAVAHIAPQTLLVEASGWMYAFKIFEVTMLAMLVYSDLSLGPSGANITLKRLQTRGPYGIVRHPATVCKLLLWWVQSGVYGAFWNTQLVLGHLGWNIIYVLRALTEERHLKRFPEYRAYMKKVRYRFIPGIM